MVSSVTAQVCFEYWPNGSGDPDPAYTGCIRQKVVIDQRGRLGACMGLTLWLLL
jgi:hypothetical protein